MGRRDSGEVLEESMGEGDKGPREQEVMGKREEGRVIFSCFHGLSKAGQGRR